MAPGPGQSESGGVGAQVQHRRNFGWCETVVGDQFQDFALTRAEGRQTRLEKGSLAGGVDRGGDGIFLGRSEEKVSVGGFDQEPPGAGPPPSLFGQDSPGDSEQPGEGGVGLRDVSAGGLEGHEKGFGDEIGDILRIGAPPQPIQGDGGNVPTKERAKRVSVPIGRSRQQGGVGVIQGLFRFTQLEVSIKNVTNCLIVLRKPTGTRFALVIEGASGWCRS